MRKYEVKITATAEQDIKEIFDYISIDSVNRAVYFIDELENQIDSLEKLPERCPIISESKEIGIELRHLIYGNYRTIYLIENTKVYILRVIHVSRILNLELLSKK